MKLYVAGHNQAEAREVAQILEQAGHTIRARWLDGVFKRTSCHTEGECESIARICADDVSECDALVLCSSVRRVPGGKFVEAGIAIGQGKRVFVLGHRENMLMWHPLVLQFCSLESMLSSFRCNPKPKP